MAGLPEIETEDWFRDWRAPDAFLTKARVGLAKLTKHGGGLLLEKSDYKYLAKAVTIGKFASALAAIGEDAPPELQKLAPTYVRLNTKQFPHFQLHLDGEEVGFELIDADRRDKPRPVDPAKRAPHDDDDEAEPERIEEFAVGAIEHAIKARLKRDYGFKTNLVIQLKPPMEGMLELAVERLVELTQPARARCLSVWVMSPVSVVRTWPKPLSWKAAG
jgi:hypothetical protein